MSQLIKQLQAAQTQNTFATSEAAAKIISSSGKRSHKNYYRFFTVTLLASIGIYGIYFLGSKKKSIQKPLEVTIPTASHIQISVKPLQLSSKEFLNFSDKKEKLTTSFNDNPYQHGIRLYIKDLPEFISSLGLFFSKNLDSYLKHCTQIVQHKQEAAKLHVANKKTFHNPVSKVISSNDTNPIIHSFEIPTHNLIQENYNEQDDFVITTPKLTEDQQHYCEAIYDLLNRMQIESVREDGSQSRLKANGHVYHPNMLVSMKPRLTWIGIQQNELIFNDEYKQEYRKKISSN